MASSASKNIGLGIFILVGLALFTAFIFFIGANKSLFGSTTEVATVFHNISGLQPGANVRFSGINVGTVEKIQITSDTTVKVTMRLDNSVVPYVKKDSRASIGSDGIMGDKTLNLTAGSVQGESIAGGDVLMAEEPLELDSIFARAATMAGSVATITSNVADITTNIKEGKGMIGALLYDDKLAKETRTMMAGLTGTVRSLNTNLRNTESGTQAFSENMKALQSNFLFKGYFKKKEKEEKKLDKAAKKREAAVKDSIEAAEKAAKKAEKKQARLQRKTQRRIEKQIARAARQNSARQQAVNKDAKTETPTN